MLCDCECEMERQADRLWLSETVESIKYVKNEGRAWGSLCQSLFFDKTVKESVFEMDADLQTHVYLHVRFGARHICR